MKEFMIFHLVVLVFLYAVTTETTPPTTTTTTTTTTTPISTPIPTTQDPLEARYILCQVRCQERYEACLSDPANVYYRISVAINPGRPLNSRRHREKNCWSRKNGCDEMCTWIKEQSHVYNRNCTATNFLAGLDFNKPGFSLRDELKSLKYIVT